MSVKGGPNTLAVYAIVTVSGLLHLLLNIIYNIVVCDV